MRVLMLFFVPEQTNRMLLSHNKFLLLFMLAFLWLCGFSAFSGYYVLSIQDELVEGFKNYVLCNATMRDDCENEHPIPFWIAVVATVNFCSIGTVLFFVFGLEPKIVRHWKTLLTHLMRGEFEALTTLRLLKRKKRIGTMKMSGTNTSHPRSTSVSVDQQTPSST